MSLLASILTLSIWPFFLHIYGTNADATFPPQIRFNRSSSPSPIWHEYLRPLNWTVQYSNALALVALDFSAAAFAPDPGPCLAKNQAQLVMRAQLPCDLLRDQCWAYIALSPQIIVFAVRGTRTQTQLIIEIIESMTGGSVQHYFYESLQSIWNAGFGQKLRELKMANPHLPVLFTGHSLGGAIASLASAQFGWENNATVQPGDLLLITFGQPRVGNIAYARAHDQLVPNSFRLVHRYDIVPHLPYCYERLIRPFRCIPLHNHGPFHHGTEIWFPAEDMDSENSLFIICNRHPYGEDQRCSNAHFVHFQVKDHLFYFGKDVDGYGNQGCQDEQPHPTMRMPSSSLVGREQQRKLRKQHHHQRRPKGRRPNSTAN